MDYTTILQNLEHAEVSGQLQESTQSIKGQMSVLKSQGRMFSAMSSHISTIVVNTCFRSLIVAFEQIYIDASSCCNDEVYSIPFLLVLC